MKSLQRSVFALLLIGLSGPAFAEEPAPSAEPTIRLDLTQQEARDLQGALDAAIRASGYSRISVSALGLGSKLERAAADTAKSGASK